MTEATLQIHIKERLDKLEDEVHDERWSAYTREQELIAAQCKERWEHHDVKHKLEAEALKLQAKEYERRLEDLNHAHGQIKEIQGTYLPREMYVLEQKEISNRVRSLEDFKNTMTGKAIIIAGLIATLSAILGGILSKFL